VKPPDNRGEKHCFSAFSDKKGRIFLEVWFLFCNFAANFDSSQHHRGRLLPAPGAWFPHLFDDGINKKNSNNLEAETGNEEAQDYNYEKNISAFEHYPAHFTVCHSSGTLCRAQQQQQNPHHLLRWQQGAKTGAAYF
jgi:hypothetical protein